MLPVSPRRGRAPRTGARPAAGPRDERGYVAVMTALMLTVLMGLSAFAVDVGHWYLVGQEEQRAADAAALAGVTSLPGNQAQAFDLAKTYAKANGYATATDVTVTPSRAGATQLRVTVDHTVDNYFGSLLGRPRTTVSRTATAEFSGPVPLGSPCNRFGDDPDPGSTSSSNCSGSGAFWANVGSPAASKISGDAFQNNSCLLEDGCTLGTNTDYDPDGYVYTVTVREAVNNLTIEAFDPAQVVVGDTCGSNLGGASALPSSATKVSNPGARYTAGPGAWCTGDMNFGTGLTRAQFTVRSPGATPWEPLSWPVACQQTFQPYNGALSKVLDTRTPEYTARPDVADNFRQWVRLCRFNGLVQPGTYAVQVKTNGLGADTQGGHNRFALRAWGTASGDQDRISVAGFSKMAMYGNTPSGTSRFHLARIPSSSNGQLFSVNLFDIGDGAKPGSTIRVVPPSETGGSFSGCIGSGKVNGGLSNCEISVNSTFNGKWQTITVPIPASYTCNDSSATGCWVRLEFFYGAGSQPADTTSWTASLEGDPIRLIE